MNFKLLEYVHQYIAIYSPSETIGLKWNILVQGTPWFCLDDIKKMYRYWWGHFGKWQGTTRQHGEWQGDNTKFGKWQKGIMMLWVTTSDNK